MVYLLPASVGGGEGQILSLRLGIWSGSVAASVSRKGGVRVVEELSSSSRPPSSRRRRPFRLNRRCRESEIARTRRTPRSGWIPRVKSRVSKNRSNRAVSDKTGRVRKPTGFNRTYFRSGPVFNPRGPIPMYPREFRPDTGRVGANRTRP
jgi:hypothetical protein